MRGILATYRGERNFRVQSAAAWAALALARLVDLDAVRLALLVALIGVVLSAETMNTAVEVLVDRLIPGRDAAAGAAKDLAAGAVLLVALGALAAAAALFWPDWLRPLAMLAGGWARRPASAIAGVVGEVLLVVWACSRSHRPWR